MERPRIGEHYYASWGYDQTNIDYVVITSISPTGKTVKARCVANKQVGDAFQERIVAPGTPYGREFTLHVRESTLDGRPKLVGSYPFISSDQSSKKMGTFFKYTGPLHETKAEFGH